LLNLAKSSLVTRLHASIGLVLLVVFTVVTWLDLRREEGSVNRYGSTQLELQRNDYAQRINQAEQDLTRKLSLHLEMMADFARAPLINRVSETDAVLDITDERIISGFRNCFELSAKVLVISCLKAHANDFSTMRTIASFNRLFIKTAAEHLIEDSDVEAVYVLDWEDQLYLGIRQAGQVGHLPMQSINETDQHLPTLDYAVLHDNEYLGKIVIVYNTNSIGLLKKATEEKLRQTEQLISQSTQLQVEQVSRYRIMEGILLFCILLAAISWVSYTTIVKPLQRLKRSAEFLARGQLNADIDTSRKDELGSLAQAFSHMRDAMRDSIGEMERQKELAQTTLASIGDGVITTHTDGSIRYLNPVAEAMTGWYTAQATGRSIDDVFRIVDEVTRLPLPGPIARYNSGGILGNPEQHAILLAPHGREAAVIDNVAPIRDSAENLLGYVVTFHDVTEQRELSRMLAHQASHDALTGLVNRTEFERRVRNALRQSSDNTDHHVLCYIDLDQFKLVNDTAGHIAGDHLLIQLAHTMSQHIRSRDVLARLGGDEFGLLLEHCPPEHALKIIESMHHAIEQQRFAWDNKSFAPSASIGVVFVNPLLQTAEEIFRAADSACYCAKEAGRNRIHVHQPLSDEHTEKQGDQQWVDRIHHAISSNSLVLHCQPIIPLQSAPTPHIYELLLRMKGHENTLISPGSFIPTAERYNIIYGLDRWVIRHALSWLQQPQNAALCLSINLSSHTLCHPGFPELLSNLLKEKQVTANRICLEVTANSALNHLPRVAQNMQELKKLGVKLMLEDVGNTFASLGYIKSLPVDYIKIDGLTSREIARNNIDFTLVKAINDIAHAMGIQTIAKHVENTQTRNKLAEIGVDFGQGNGLEASMPLDHLTRDTNHPPGNGTQPTNTPGLVH
jgi:diguanylate cyclase (GGDEF)-like protein/PAS domain S-box-containing protein